MKSTIQTSLIRELVKEVISELIPDNDQNTGATVKNSSPKKKAVVAKTETRQIENVRISNDKDLSAFIIKLVSAVSNPKVRQDILSGRKVFCLDGKPAAGEGFVQQARQSEIVQESITKGLVNEKRISELAKKGIQKVILGKSVLLTPLGRDKAKNLNIIIEKVKK